MKALISRDSHRPEQRYSGVYHIQGAMITDADLDERSTITRERTDNLGNETVKDGVPAEGGAVAIAADGSVSLVPGIIYADGVRGLLAASAPLTQGAPLDIFTKQADLPFGPALPGSGDRVVYADIWERSVFPLEDPYLADAGLHGAVTGFRTRTMTQLKSAPATALADIEAGTGAFPQIGTARIEVTPLNAEILADECDPCADVVSAEQQVANALWRLEIISIDGTPDNPTSIRIAWSEENAGEIAPASVSAEMFERANKVYEYFSPITEARSGAYANAAHARLPAFVGDLSTNPNPAKDHNGQDWPFVRRWDGFATITPGTNTIANSLGAGFDLSMSGGKVTLRVTAFEVELDLSNAAVLPGDYWLVEMRRHAPEAERIRLVRETPIGILHHYCTLFTVHNGAIVALSDAQRRKLTFPALSDLPADHVGLINNCEKLYGDAENVQEALDNLCSISADDIGFNSGNCPVLYDNAATVQEALDALCRIDFSVDESFRLLFDWGVVCGLVAKMVRAGSGLITISSGSYLDRSGRITKFAGGQFDLSKLEIGKGIAFKDADAFQGALLKGEVCLALASEDGGKTSLHLVPPAIAFGPADPSFSERVQACVEKKKYIRVDDLVANLPVRQKAVANKLFLATSAEGAFRGTARLTRSEFAEAEAFNVKAISAFNSVANEEETALLKQRVEQARTDNPIGNVTGQAAEIRQMQQATAVYTAFWESEQERLERCLCENLFPPCPPALGNAPYYVPIACVRGSFDPPGIFLREVCSYCCRKQAMTWRSLQYFIGDMRTKVAKQMARFCCEGDERPPRPGLTHDPQRFAAMNLVSFAEDYRLVNTFLDRSETLPSDFVTRVQVNDLSVVDAVNQMKGTGVEVAETIDINDARAFETIESKLTGIGPQDLLMSRGEVRPGDKVALLTQEGVARGYVLVERGSGRLPFQVAKAGAGKELDLSQAEELVRQADAAKEGFATLEQTRDTLMSDLDRLKTETSGLESQRDSAAEAIATVRDQMSEFEKTRATLSESIGAATKEGFATLEKKRDDLLSDIGRLKAEAGELEKQRTATATAVATMRDQMGELQKTRTTLTEAIAAANRDLAAVDTNHKALLDSMRETQPVNAVLGNDKARVLAALAGEGVVTVGDIARLNAATAKRLETAGILRAGEAAELREKAAAFIKRRPG